MKLNKLKYKNKVWYHFNNGGYTYVANIPDCIDEGNPSYYWMSGNGCEGPSGQNLYLLRVLEIFK